MLGELVVKLKKLVKQLPFNLYDLSSREEYFLKEIIDTINKMEVPNENNR